MNWGVPHEDPRRVVLQNRRSQIVEGDMLWNIGEPAARQFLTDWLSERYGDFYPLTPYSQAPDAWVAYQLHLAEMGEGLEVELGRVPDSASIRYCRP
ncbi:MAG: hypothetical protein ACUVUC_04730 [Thermoguttaceae bacterium]